MRQGQQPVTNIDEALKVVQVLSQIEDVLPKLFFRQNDKALIENLAMSEYVTPSLARMVEDPIPLVDLKAQKARIQDRLAARVNEVFRSMNFINGHQFWELENKLAEYSGAKHCIACGSGTDAITFALMALNMQAGDAVLVPALCFVASVEPIVLLGGTLIFVDIEQQNLTVDPNLISESIGIATRNGR